jgi:hypothetical protein
MARLVTRHEAVAPRPAEGIRISKLERKALDDRTLQAGCTLGDPYVVCDPCWHRWVCARLMEHLRGEHRWEELDRGDFGLLRQEWHANLALVEDVVARIAGGAEPLHVLLWAVATGQPLDDVVAILRTLDVNARRVRRFAWLTPAAPCGYA